ncbi:HNH endonuclease [bacterium]|nr:HNH endonuclease [bacterium]
MAKAIYNDPLYKKNRAIVLEASGYTCHYCRGPANTADHIIPVSFGGGNEIDNLLPSCLSCNSSRKNKSMVRLKYWNRKY